MDLQPLLHDLLVATMAPTQAWSAPDGQVRATGAQGFWAGDLRVLSRAELTVDGREPEVIAAGPAGPGVVEVVLLARGFAARGADPTLRLTRRRQATAGAVRETVVITYAGQDPITVPIAVVLGCDLAPMGDVKAGHRFPALVAHPADTGGVPSLRWSQDEASTVTLTAPGAQVDLATPAAPVLTWELEVAPGVPATVTWEVAATRPDAVVGPPSSAASWSVPGLRCDDRRLPALLARSLEDLGTLRMSAGFAPDEVFLAAGAPWFFTLFGRDSIWAARMLLPLGTELAGGTLRTLAARQGTRTDPETAEQPGKILHEVRSHELPLGEDGRVLPPLYYGTVDATPLWVCLLHDAWRWGLPADQVEALLPAAEAALAWMAEHGDADGDGFLEYLDLGGHGLANQGWKDSGDSVQWRDGRLARGPIALCEVQGYAYEAAMSGAALLEAFGRPGAARWRDWAAALADRFRAAFWIEPAGSEPYPAIALDADKRAVDSLTSNIGHLLGTGLLDAREEAVVARHLGSGLLDSGYGVRTMSTREAGYWPLSYHGGSVWAHDTAIVVAGLVRAGHPQVAGRLAEGLLAAATDLGQRLPELYSGDTRGSVPAVVPYPAACRPQAWSAASAVVLLTAVLGLDPDVPAGTLRVAPVMPMPLGGLRVTGLRLAGVDLTIDVGADGVVHEVSTSAPVALL